MLKVLVVASLFVLGCGRHVDVNTHQDGGVSEDMTKLHVPNGSSQLVPGDPRVGSSHDGEDGGGWPWFLDGGQSDGSQVVTDMSDLSVTQDLSPSPSPTISPTPTPVCVKIDCPKVGDYVVINDVTITVVSLQQKTDSPDYCGFTVSSDVVPSFTVKSGLELASGTGLTWTNANGCTGSTVKGISNITFCL